MHENGLIDFLNPEGFGYVKSRREVAGFRPHQFRSLPSLQTPEQKVPVWIVHRLELVSLLKHEVPAVYLSEHLPRMDELREAQTRPLDAFETTALTALRGAKT